jgi:hypothetical protein
MKKRGPDTNFYKTLSKTAFIPGRAHLPRYKQNKHTKHKITFFESIAAHSKPHGWCLCWVNKHTRTSGQKMCGHGTAINSNPIISLLKPRPAWKVMRSVSSCGCFVLKYIILPASVHIYSLCRVFCVWSRCGWYRQIINKFVEMQTRSAAITKLIKEQRTSGKCLGACYRAQQAAMMEIKRAVLFSAARFINKYKTQSRRFIQGSARAVLWLIKIARE